MESLKTTEYSNDEKKSDNNFNIEINNEKIPFWSENPNILFDPKHILEFFPIDTMTYNSKLNAITRIVIVLTLIGFMFSQNLRLLFISSITIFAIFLLHYYHNKETKKVNSKKLNDEKENFDNPTMNYLKENNLPSSPEIFDKPQPNNPFSNVLITDYEYNVNKKPAPPSFNQNINNDILSKAKQLVCESNPDQPDIADKLFKDLGEQLDFEQSLRPFNSNPSTTIPNDQGAFAEFCYGSMISCKEGNRFACARNLSRHVNN